MKSKIMKVIDQVGKYFIFTCLICMLVLILIATVSRISGVQTITWGEEASRYLMIWMSMISISIGFKNSSHLGLEFLVGKMHGKLKTAVLILRMIIIDAFLILIVYNGMRVVMTQMKFVQYSPSLGLPMHFAYISIPIGFFFSIFRFTTVSISEIKQQISGSQELKKEE